MRSHNPDTSNPFPGRIFLTAVACELILVALYWLDILTGGTFQLLHALFDLDSEGNIPAWFSSSQLFAVAITFFSCARRKGTDRRPSRAFFLLAGIASLYVSSDETAQIHERVTAVIGARYIDWVPPFAAQNFFFVMVLVAVLVSVGQMLAEDILKLWIHYPRVLVLMILGVSIGLTGGMVVETLGYKFLNSNSIWYRVEVTAEEFMEMMGASFILLAALQLRRRIRSRLAMTTTRVQPKQVHVLTKYQAVS